jgi:hypothetical protein
MQVLRYGLLVECSTRQSRGNSTSNRYMIQLEREISFEKDQFREGRRQVATPSANAPSVRVVPKAVYSNRIG